MNDLSDIKLLSYPLESALMFHTQLDPAVLRNGLFLDPGGFCAVFQLELRRQCLPVDFLSASRRLGANFVKEFVGNVSIFIHPQALRVPFQALKTDGIEN